MKTRIMKAVLPWLSLPEDNPRSKFTPITDISRVEDIPEQVVTGLEEVTDSFSFKANEYYLDLINWDDPDDPIRRLIVPNPAEMDGWGEYDASDEASNTRIQGLQHKYPETALFLVTDNCTGFCRYCFRKRLFLAQADEVTRDYSAVYSYITAHPEINDVILSGGDPLSMSTRRLGGILKNLAAIPHVKTVRIGSKTPAYNPMRLGGDAELQRILSDFTAHSGKTLYLIAHFDHPRELTDIALEELAMYRDCGLVVLNQCPILRGINDDAATLSELYNKLHAAGVAPYYAFQGRPVRGNEQYLVPITEAYKIFHDAVKDLTGLAKRARYVMSHSSGKIEILGVDEKHIYMRYHRAKNPKNRERFMIFDRDDSAFWLDSLTSTAAEHTPGQPGLIGSVGRLVFRDW